MKAWFVKYFLWELVKIIATSFVIVWFIRHFLFQSFLVSGASMEPNVHDRDYLIINEISYRFHNPERGEIVVVRDKRNPSQFFIKRVIGLPKETVKIEGGRVFIFNDSRKEGFELTEPYLPPERITRGDKTTNLNSSEYFLMGDNRGASLDSRALGAFDRSDIVGEAWIRIWPVGQFGIFPKPLYLLVHFVQSFA